MSTFQPSIPHSESVTSPHSPSINSVQQLQWFQVLFESVAEGVGFLNIEGKLLDLNQPLLEMLNCQRQAAIERVFWELPPWQYSFAVQSQLKEAVIQAISGQVVCQNIELPNPQGDTVQTFSLSIKATSERLGAVLLLTPQLNAENKLTQMKPPSINNQMSLNEEHFKRIMLHDVAGIYVCHSSGHIIEANEMFLSLVGYTRDDIQANQLQLQQIMSFEDRLTNQLISNNSVKDSVSRLYEKEYIRKDGSRIPVLVKVAILEEGESHNLEVGFVLDLSDYKQVEAALHRSREQLHFALEVADMGTWELDLLTHEEVWSDKIYAIYGMLPEAISPTYQVFYNSIHPEDREMIKLAHEQAIQTGMYKAEHRIAWSDGSVHWVSSVGKVFYDSTGQPTRLVGVDANITPIKRTQQQLLIAEERLRYLLSAGLATIYSAKVTSSYDFTFVSDNITKILGYLPQECIADNFWIDRLHCDDTSTVATKITQLFDQEVCAFEYRFQCKNGTYLWLYDQARLIRDESGNPLEIIGSLIDISDRKHAEAAIQEQAEQERALNHLKDNFLSTVSHELRTPITNIKMAVQMLEVVLNQLNIEDEKVARYLQILQEQCNQEINLLNTLLDLQALEAGGKSLHLTSICLQTWLAGVVASFESRIQSQRQLLYVDIPDNLPPIISDEACLMTIVSELLNNACKYTPPEERMSVTVRIEDDILQLSVCNSGIEIPATELPRIFDKFYRVTGTDRWKHGGTGLGLSLVQRLVEHLGGNIEVESSANLISFMVKLPIAPNQAQLPVNSFRHLEGTKVVG